jgi:hypothetical protein
MVPIGIIKEFDKICRAIFWAGDDHVNGGQCKVAWEEVCAPISKGGLGFRCLHSHNIALLMKFLSKLHSDPTTPWKIWFGNAYGWSDNRDLGDLNRLDSVIWKDLLACLPAFRNATSVKIAFGSRTSFWLDQWLDGASLAQRFPSLFSHATKPNCSVKSVCSSSPFVLDLQPRLSHAAQSELHNLHTLLATVVLDENGLDVRISKFDSRPLTTKSAYLAAFDYLQEVPLATPTWKNYSTNRCRTFLWLANGGRLFTNARRFRRGLSTSDACPFCSSPASTKHLFLHCLTIQPF